MSMSCFYSGVFSNHCKFSTSRQNDWAGCGGWEGEDGMTDWPPNPRLRYQPGTTYRQRKLMDYVRFMHAEIVAIPMTAKQPSYAGDVEWMCKWAELIDKATEV